jgi:hypothetical protein
MAIRKSGQSAAAVDFWFDRRCLTVEVSSQEKTLTLFVAAEIDSPSTPILLFAGDPSRESWRQLKETALGQR